MNEKASIRERSGVADMRPDWRRVCRTAAEDAAIEDERAGWGVTDAEEIPFLYRWEHVQQVVGLALWLAEETGADVEIVEAAAWLHDVRKWEKQHARRGAEAAREILAGTNFPAGKIEAVADAISKHEGLFREERESIKPLEAAVLWDADKLSKVGVEALMVVMSSRHMAGRPLQERRRRNLEFVESVLPRTVASMNTTPARTLAEKRYRQNLAAMAAWTEEEALEQRYLKRAGQNATGPVDD